MSKNEDLQAKICQLEAELEEANERIALLAQEVVLLRSNDPGAWRDSDLVRSWYQDVPN